MVSRQSAQKELYLQKNLELFPPPPLEKLVLKTVQWNVIIICYYYLLLLLLLSLTILVIGFTGPPTIHFKFIVKCDNCYYKVRQLILLQSTMVCYYKVRQLLLQCATGITKCKNFGRCREVQLAVSATSSKISQFRYYIIKKFLKCVSQRNGVTGCYPLQFRPCFGFHLLQLVLSFELIFVRRVPR